MHSAVLGREVITQQGEVSLGRQWEEKALFISTPHNYIHFLQVFQNVTGLSCFHVRYQKMIQGMSKSNLFL